MPTMEDKPTEIPIGVTLHHLIVAQIKNHKGFLENLRASMTTRAAKVSLDRQITANTDLIDMMEEARLTAWTVHASKARKQGSLPGDVARDQPSNPLRPRARAVRADDRGEPVPGSPRLAPPDNQLQGCADHGSPGPQPVELH